MQRLFSGRAGRQHSIGLEVRKPSGRGGGRGKERGRDGRGRGQGEGHSEGEWGAQAPGCVLRGGMCRLFPDRVVGGRQAGGQAGRRAFTSSYSAMVRLSEGPALPAGPATNPPSATGCAARRTDASALPVLHACRAMLFISVWTDHLAWDCSRQRKRSASGKRVRAAQPSSTSCMHAYAGAGKDESHAASCGQRLSHVQCHVGKG